MSTTSATAGFMRLFSRSCSGTWRPPPSPAAMPAAELPLPWTQAECTAMRNWSKLWPIPHIRNTMSNAPGLVSTTRSASTRMRSMGGWPGCAGSEQARASVSAHQHHILQRLVAVASVRQPGRQNPIPRQRDEQPAFSSTCSSGNGMSASHATGATSRVPLTSHRLRTQQNRASRL